MSYQYRVRDPLGNEHQGTIEAVSLDDAQQQLCAAGFRVLKLDEEDAGEGLFSRRVSKREIIYLTSQLAVMVDTGINLSVALGSIIEQEDNPAFRSVLTDIRSNVESGEDFSAALQRHSQLFNHTYVSLVRASEATGTLGEMLERIAGYLQKEQETRGKIRAAMAYPVVMAVLAVGVTVFLLVFVLPKFAPLFNKKGVELPALTRVMMSVSHAMIGWWYLWVLGAAAAVAGFVTGKRTEPGRKLLDWLKINAPIIGPMYRRVIISRTIRTLGTMLSSGVSVLEALELSSHVAGNYYYQTLWQNVLTQVTSGNQIHQALAGSDLIPNMLVQMIRSGEETAKLDLVLTKVSSHYDLEVDQALKATTSMIEPIMITVMGVVVGSIALGLLLPIFELSRPHH